MPTQCKPAGRTHAARAICCPVEIGLRQLGSAARCADPTSTTPRVPLQAVGIAQGVLGVFGAVSGVPAGYIADHTRRDRTLHGFGVVQIGASNQ